jgi:hypothetical protein
VGAALAAPPVVASFFVPMPLSLGAVGLPTSDTVEHRETVTLDFSGLQAAHDLERAQARVAALQAIHAAQAKHMQTVMDRVGSIAREAASPTPAKQPATSDQCCGQLNTQLQDLAKRVDQLEKLVNYHDKAIRKDPSTTIPGPDSQK